LVLYHSNVYIDGGVREGEEEGSEDVGHGDEVWAAWG
jgi:hypothetical protein